MIVVDASAIIEFLLGTRMGKAVRRALLLDADIEPPMHAPSHLDAEVAQVIRRLEASGELSADRAHLAIRTLMDLPVTRHHLTPLLPRIWTLRPNLTAYDSAYVALAEGLQCPLLTLDRRLARSSGGTAKVIVPD